MVVYWSHKRRPSEIIGAERRAEAKDSETITSKDVNVKVGKGVVFFQELEYGIAGFSLTLEELTALVKETEQIGKSEVKSG